MSDDSGKRNDAGHADDVLRRADRTADDRRIRDLMNALDAGECSGEPRPWDHEAFLARMTARYGG
ncbi:type II toxin-antitoxin system ParD family antitoxin (plasmid) [Tistrella mobilis]|uniref:Type II toxin-antitoxin system ParD family antitoxin n=1 Tax=Tistrella mobilis TaxID=171437 RepID=A0A162LKD7_9PROT|nr:type II toxin-antitoxin system ParD family antitoxin [Tistrella mobilis]KYO55341.1 hypothetical protein AUP44_23915 [Tistrella mobilis]